MRRLNLANLLPRVLVFGLLVLVVSQFFLSVRNVSLNFHLAMNVCNSLTLQIRFLTTSLFYSTASLSNNSLVALGTCLYKSVRSRK